MKPRIMVVEDEAVVALNLKQTLTGMGYEVSCIAASYDQAVAGAARVEPDLVLMDINISGDRDGIETAASIDRPVVYLTAYAEQSTLDRARETAPYGYLLKPFSDRELHATLQMALERCRIEKQLRKSEEDLLEAYGRIQDAKSELELHACELQLQKERLLVTLNAIGDGVVTTDARGIVSFINPAAEEMTGWRPEDACGQPSSRVLDFRDGETKAPLASPIESLLLTRRTTGLPDNCLLVARDGNMRQVEDSVALIRSPAGEVLGSVIVFHDVSEARRLAAEMTYQATHDALTGLFNRLEFERRLSKVINGPESDRQLLSVAYLDLDQFKIVNDTCGHAAGDELLRQIATLLRLPLRTSDCLARLGGDEFGVLLEGCPPDIALRIIGAMKERVNGFRFVWGDRVFPVGVSIGMINFGGADPQRRLELSEVLRLADSACYTAKESGRNCIHVYDPNNYLLNKIHEEMDLFGRIHRALAEDQFVLYAQEIAAFSPDDAYEQHVEILLRMQDRDGGLIPPMAFIPAAERYGLMLDVDRWVIRTAFGMIKASGHRSKVLYGINLSGFTMNDEGALQYISDQLAEWDLPPDSICFEITETAAISNILTASAFIAVMRRRGCKFALDDFGSGMASFAYLKNFQVDFLKIDGSFVKHMVTDAVDAAMVQSINGIGRVMGMKTIAEYVENSQTVEMLKDMGVNFGQGYGLARPEPFAEVLKRAGMSSVEA